MRELRRSGERDLWLVVAVAVAVRIALLLVHRTSALAGLYRLDTLYYRTWALELAAGAESRPGVYEQGPLYAYLLAGVFRTLGPGETPVIALQMLCGVVTAVLLFACARRVFGERGGLAGGLIAALYGPFLVHESLLMKTFLEPLCAAAALWCGLRHLGDRRLRWAALGGGAVGLGVLVREVHVLLLAPLAAGIVTAAAPGLERARRAAAGCVALAAAFTAVILPFALRNAAVSGEFAAVTSAGGENVYLAYGPEATGYYQPPAFVRPFERLEHEDFRHEAWLRTGRVPSRAESSRFWLREGLRSLAADPVRAIRLTAVKAAAAVNDYELPDNEFHRVAKEFLPPLRALPTFGWVAGLGLAGLLRLRRAPAARLLPFGFLAALALGLVSTFILGRYRLAFAAVWLVFAGGGAAALLDRTWARARPARWAAAVFGALIATALSFARPPGLDPGKRDALEARYREEVANAARYRDLLPGLEAATRAPRPSAETWLQLAAACAATGRAPEEIGALEQAIAANPGHLPSRWRLARALSDGGRPREARRQLEELARLLPGFADARFALGGVLVQEALDSGEGRAQPLAGEAERHFREAVALDPGHVEAHVQLGRLLLIRRDAAAADREFRAALRLAPGHPEARRLLELARGLDGA